MKTPCFQFYVKDWLSSTVIALMSPAQEGAYIRLLCHAWSDPDCTLPDDDQQLAQLSRLGEHWLNGGSTLVRQCFQPHPSLHGRLYNARLLEEREKQAAWREKSRAGGVKSAEVRRSKTKGGSALVGTNGQPKGNIAVCSLLLEEEEEKTPSSKVQDAWNCLGDPFSKIAEWNDERQAALRNRWKKEFWRKNWQQALSILKQSDFCRGKSSSGWIANIDFFLKPKTVPKLIEGFYSQHNGVSSNGNGRRSNSVSTNPAAVRDGAQAGRYSSDRLRHKIAPVDADMGGPAPGDGSVDEGLLVGQGKPAAGVPG